MQDTPVVEAATMLLAFHAENVRSFRDAVEISMEATTLAEPEAPRTVTWRGGAGRNATVNVLPSAGIFGANASGKTNFLRAMDDMRDFVRYSFVASTKGRKSERPLRAFRKPFRLDSAREAETSTFEVDLILDGIRHRYGFEVDDHRVISEWAYRYPNGKAATIFRRDGDRLDVKTPGARAAKSLVRSDVLFLSAARSAEYEELSNLYDWFENNLELATAASRPNRWRETFELISNETRREHVLALLRAADLGITDAQPRSPEPEEIERMHAIANAFHSVLPEEFPEINEEDAAAAGTNLVVGLILSHQSEGGTVEFDSGDESLGTLVWLGLIGPVLEALANGTVLLADEIEASLHPQLVSELVRMFQSTKTNPNGAQLIFNTHEARLLGNSSGDRIIGRDQAWFTEKLRDGSTRLYPLAEMGPPRKEEAVARRYLEGRYGGTPLISHAEFAELARSMAGASE